MREHQQLRAEHVAKRYGFDAIGGIGDDEEGDGRIIAQEIDVPAVTVSQVVQMVFDGITEVLVSKGRIELRNFGVFEVHERKSRTVRNPRTGQQVTVPKKCVVSFKPGLEMIQEVRRLSFAPSDGQPAIIE